jgi:hypothetical protein
MKIELEKETKPDGRVIYFISKIENGHRNTLEAFSEEEFDKAEKYFEACVKGKGVNCEIIKSVEL